MPDSPRYTIQMTRCQAIAQVMTFILTDMDNATLTTMLQDFMKAKGDPCEVTLTPDITPHIIPIETLGTRLVRDYPGVPGFKKVGSEE